MKGVDGVDGVLLKAPQVFVEATAAALAVQATLVMVSRTVLVATVEVGAWDALGDVDHMRATLPPKCGFAAGRGGWLAVGATVAAGRCALYGGDPNGGDCLRVGMEGRRKGDGGREGQTGVGWVEVVAHWNVGTGKIGIVGY